MIFHNLDTTEVKRRSFIPICSFALDSATFEKVDLELFSGKGIYAVPWELA